MSETARNIEAFVEKLQKDGVQAGHAEAKRIKVEAQEQAEQIINAARDKAEKVLKAAESEAEKFKAQTRSELQLAVRDTVLRLQQALQSTVSQIIKQSVNKELNNSQFVQKLIKEIVKQYAQADSNGQRGIELKLSDKMLQELRDRIVAALSAKQSQFGSQTQLAGGLREAGFEYSSGDGIVEITAESVSAVLADLVGPELQNMLVVSVGEESVSPACAA